MMHVIIDEGLLGRAAIVEARTRGIRGTVREIVEKYPPERVEQITGIPAGQTDCRPPGSTPRRKPASILYAMGITQHTHGTDNVKALANLAMLCGKRGRSGGGCQSLAGTEQRPGGLRHGRPCPTSTPAIRGWTTRPSRAEVRGGLGARSLPGNAGPDLPRR